MPILRTHYFPPKLVAITCVCTELMIFRYSGGIEGTLRMQIIGDNGSNFVNSLAGTADLGNVKIKAASSSSFTMSPPTINTLHEGVVSGWPDMPPAA